MGGDFIGDSGTLTAITATTATDGAKSWTTNALKGHLFGILGTVYGVVLSNTGQVVTVDKWYTPATPGGAAAATPANGSAYTIFPGSAPASWLAFSQDAVTPGATDATLPSEINVAGGGLNRVQGLYAHTVSTNIYTLSKTVTATANDAQPTNLNKVGVFYSAVAATGPLLFEDLIGNPPPLLTGDSTALTVSVNMG